MAEGGQLVDHQNGRGIALRLRGIRTQFGDNIIHDNLDFDVFEGEIVGLMGGSGTGKSVLPRTIVGLNEARKGTIEMLGVDASTLQRSALSVWVIRHIQSTILLPKSCTNDY